MLSRVSRSRSPLSSRALWLEPRVAADPFCAAVREVIAAIPAGQVATYGQVAHLAGKPWGARQVAWILHSQSEKYKLPWQRVIGASGRISLPPGRGLEEQRRLLRREGVVVAASGGVDLGRFRWRPEDEFAGKKKGPAGPAPFI
jgi:methylated-DNA-protein-cysteine methyltransferase-like protein